MTKALEELYGKIDKEEEISKLKSLYLKNDIDSLIKRIVELDEKIRLLGQTTYDLITGLGNVWKEK